MALWQEAKQEDSPGRHRHSPGALDFSQIVGGAMFGRPAMSEAEMEAVDSGGAENAPEVCTLKCSRGIGGVVGDAVAVVMVLVGFI